MCGSISRRRKGVAARGKRQEVRKRRSLRPHPPSPKATADREEVREDFRAPKSRGEYTKFAESAENCGTPGGKELSGLCDL